MPRPLRHPKGDDRRARHRHHPHRGVRRHRPRRRSRRRERRRPRRAGRPHRRDRRERAGRRRVLVLGLHALARPCCARRTRSRAARRVPGAARPSPATSTSLPSSPAATRSRSNWNDDGQVRLARRAPASTWSAATAASAARAQVTVTTADGDAPRARSPATRWRRTGSDAALPDIPGLREAQPVDQPRGHQRRRRCPASLAIIGGGVVAAEMATAYAGLRHARSR